jgi:hypothetical protein
MTTKFETGDKVQTIAWTGDVISDGIVARASETLIQVRYHFVADAAGSVDTFELVSGT